MTIGRPIPILVINLLRSPDRRENMGRQLSALGLRHRFVDAVDGKSPTFVASQPSTLTLGEIACHLSHRKCWQDLLASEDTHVLILEDDVIISPLLCEIVERRLALPDKAHIIRLETWCRSVQVHRGRSLASDGVTLHKLYKGDLGCAGYVISRTGAQRLLNVGRVGELPVDHLVFDLSEPVARGLTVYQAVPGLCVQGDIWYAQDLPEMLRSDLETERRRRFNRAKRPLTRPQKIRREIWRIERQIRAVPQWIAGRLFLRIHTVQVPFAAGKTAPGAELRGAGA